MNRSAQAPRTDDASGSDGRCAPCASRIASPAWFLFWLIMAVGLASGIQTGLRAGEPLSGVTALARGVLAGRDTLAHDYPAAWWGWRQVRATGQLPLWNPCWFAGEPFIASQTFLPFYPSNWLMGVLPFPLCFNLQYPLHLLLAAAVMAWTCRRRGLGWWAAGLAGLAWGFGGHLATLAGPGHIQKLQALAWLPLVVYGAGQLGGTRPERGVLPLGLGLALEVLAGHLQVVYMTVAAGGLECCLRLIQKSGIRNPKSETNSKFEIQNSALRTPHSAFTTRLNAGIQAAALALLLSAVLWLPTAEFARLSNRQGALSWTDAVRGSLPPEEAFEFALPRLRGDSMPHGRGAYLGRYGESPTSAPERVVSDYVGAGTLLLALLALVLPGRRREALGWLGLAALGLTLSLGGYLGGCYRLLLQIVPGLAHFRAPSAMMALTAFGLAMMAAQGAESLAGLARLPEPRRRKQATTAALVTIAVLLLAIFTLRYEAIAEILWSGARWERLGQRPGNVAVALTALRSIALAHAMIFLMASAALAAGIALCQRRAEYLVTRWLAGVFALVLGLTLAADLTINARPFWNAVDARPYEAYMQTHWAMPEWNADAARMQGPVRYLEVGGELKNWALTYTDCARGRVVGSLHGYHPVAYRDYFRLLSGLGFTHPNLLKLFAVDWLLWPVSADAAGQARPPGFQDTGGIAGMRLLHDPDARFIRPAGPIRLVQNWDALLAWLRDSAHDPYRETPVLAGDDSNMTAPGGDALRTLESKVWPLGPGELQIDYAADATGRVVISEPAASGWRAWLRQGVDGSWQPLPIGRAAGYFMLLGPLPGGTGSLRLRYDPASQRLGLYLTLLGLAWLGWRVGRRENRNKKHAKTQRA